MLYLLHTDLRSTSCCRSSTSVCTWNIWNCRSSAFFPGTVRVPRRRSCEPVEANGINYARSKATKKYNRGLTYVSNASASWYKRSVTLIYNLLTLVIIKTLYTFCQFHYSVMSNFTTFIKVGRFWLCLVVKITPNKSWPWTVWFKTTVRTNNYQIEPWTKLSLF